MIKAIIFDMDGVLIDAKDWHFDALNRALRLFGMEISHSEHVATFDGLPTRRKLEILEVSYGLPRVLHAFVNEMKQIYTMEIVHTRCKPKFNHEYALSRLKARGYKLAVASNSMRATVETMMHKAHLAQYFDVMLSNEDVTMPKPDPEIYRKTMTHLGVGAHETLILEDNAHGIQAAQASGAELLVVREVEDVTLAAIDARIRDLGGGRA